MKKKFLSVYVGDISHFGSRLFSLQRCIDHACTEVDFIFCSLIRRFVMCRKGWNTVATPAGWFEVIRGPRPPSVQWPKVNVKLDKSNLKPQSRVRGRWQDRHLLVVGTLAALDPEHSFAKTEIGSALKWVREQEVASVRVDPDAKLSQRGTKWPGWSRPSQQWWTSRGQRWTLSSQR